MGDLAINLIHEAGGSAPSFDPVENDHHQSHQIANRESRRSGESGVGRLLTVEIQALAMVVIERVRARRRSLEVVSTDRPYDCPVCGERRLPGVMNER